MKSVNLKTYIAKKRDLAWARVAECQSRGEHEFVAFYRGVLVALDDLEFLIDCQDVLAGEVHVAIHSAAFPTADGARRGS